MHKSLTIFAVTTLMASSAYAAGFAVSEHTAESAGQAGVLGSRVNNASAVFYNTAGLTLAKGTQFFLSASAIVGSSSSSEIIDGAEVKVETENPLGVLPAVFMSHQIDDTYTVGMGVFNPFGSTISWPATSTDGGTNPQRDIIRDLSLKTPTLALAGSMNMGDTVEGLSIGASVDVVMGSVYFARDLVFGSEAATMGISGSDVGVGGRFGLQYASPDVEGATFGVTFRLPVDLTFEGNIDIDFEGEEGAADYRSALPPDGEISGDLTLPMGVEFCLGSQWSENLHLGAALSFNQWSSYQELGFTLPDGSYSAAPKQWHDAFTLRFGAEYDMDGIMLRAGYMNDQTPMPEETLDASLTDMTRHYVTAGAGMAVGDMDVHFSVLYKLPMGSRSAGTRSAYAPPHKAEYTLDILMASLSVSYRSGAEEEAAE